MITDVAGRVRNVYVPASRPLLPLFEAINNSIQAIEDAHESDGHIEVAIIRDEETLFAKSDSRSDRQLAEITGFVVRDNGIGFDERNYEEFNRSDTTYKAARGGKGVGRFMWLVAFETVEIESAWGVDGVTKRRRFTFCSHGSGIEDHVCVDAPGEPRETAVRLAGLKPKYRAQCPKRSATIAAFIVEEFLDVFLGPTSPKMTIRDSAAGQVIDLDEFYEAEMVAHSERKRLAIKDEVFGVLHLRLYSTHIPEHRLYLCANDRVVTREALTGVPNLARRLQDDKGREFTYGAYVNSPVLDSSVNADRTGFRLSEDGGPLLAGEIALSDIRQAVRAHCKEFLSPYTEPIRRRKRARIQQFIESDGVMYRPIVKHLAHRFDDIDPEATNDDIDRDLYGAYQDLQAALRREGTELLQAAPSDDADFATFRQRFDEYFERISEVNRADLARYVCHRKAIIEFLRQQLSRQDDGKYSLEDRIHSIIFPRGTTSDEVPFGEHNLWLIDERLAFHVFLSSDRAIGQAEPLESDSKKEPDILVFDKAVAFGETPDVPFSSVTIIEFKRPQRNEYSEKENPFAQVARYIDDIRAGRARLADGRSFPVPVALPFYCYIVCDITPRLTEWAHHFELQATPDGLGFFGYKRYYGAYCEVISYSKLASDAEKRNQAFFEKLRLPKRVGDGRGETVDPGEDA